MVAMMCAFREIALLWPPLCARHVNAARAALLIAMQSVGSSTRRVSRCRRNNYKQAVFGDRTKGDFLWRALRLAAVHFYFWLQLLSRMLPSPMAPAGLRRHKPPRAVSSTHKSVPFAT